VIWILTGCGLALLGYNVWISRWIAEKEREKENLARAQSTVSDAWEVLTRPIAYEEELIKLPPHRPWYMPGDRRFAQGLSFGLGAGLLIAALAVKAVQPASEPPAEAVSQGALASAAQAPAKVPPAAAGGSKEGAAGPGGAAEAAPDGSTAAVPAEQEKKSTEQQTVTVVVAEGDLPETVARKLKEAGLIDDERAFLTRLSELGRDTRLQSGTFSIPTPASLDQVIEALTS
jgi:hypothetical protein